MVTSPKVSIGSVVIGQVVDKLLFIPALLAMASLLDPTTFAFSVLALAVGSACTCIGAFVAAKRAGRSFILHGFLVALITMTLSLLRFFNADVDSDLAAHSLWWEFLAWSMSLIAGILGGWIARLLRSDAATAGGVHDERD